MLVGVNAVALDPESGTGDDQYLRCVLAKMREVQSDTEFVIFTDAANHASFQGWDRVCLGGPGKPGLFSSMDSALGQAAKERKIDLLFSALDTAPATTSIPQVIYALGMRCWEEGYLRGNRRQAARLKTVKRTCANAVAFVAPSEFVRRKFLELFEIPLDRVVMAPLGIDPAFDRAQPGMAEPPYLLIVGNTYPYKNIPRMMEAFTQLRSEVSHNLVVVGRPRAAEPVDWGPRVIRIEHCPTACLAGLYQHCDLFIQPSLYEGSGVTVAEAMRAGTSVATSRTGGITEAANDNAFFFNPESVPTMVAAIRRGIEEEPEQRRKRSKFGKQVAAEYTWEQCAWKTLAAFKRL